LVITTLVSVSLSYNIIHSVVPTNFPQGMYFSALLSMTYITASTSDIGTLPGTGSNIIFQEVCYSKNSTITLEKTSHLTLSCSYINSRPGNDDSNGYSLYA